MNMMLERHYSFSKVVEDYRRQQGSLQHLGVQKKTNRKETLKLVVLMEKERVHQKQRKRKNIFQWTG